MRFLADKMSYGESRSEHIASFGSRKVRHAACIVLHLMLTRICSDQNCSSEVKIFPGGRRRPGNTERHYRLSQRRCAGEFFKHAFYSMMPDALLQGGPSPLAATCDPAASTVAKVYAMVVQRKSRLSRDTAAVRLQRFFRVSFDLFFEKNVQHEVYIMAQAAPL